jgi:hypothetical protein
MADNENEFVYVRHGDQGSDVAPGRVTRQAFDQIWSGKGFVIVSNEEAELLGSPATMMEVRGGTAEPASEPVAAEEATTTTTRKRG